MSRTWSRADEGCCGAMAYPFLLGWPSCGYPSFVDHIPSAGRSDAVSVGGVADHGPTLRRQFKPEPRKVSVQIVKRIIQLEGFYQGLAALTETREVERLEIRHERDGRTESIDQVLEQVIASWNTIFDQDKL